MGLFVRGPDAGPWPQSRAVDTLLGILEFIIQECLNGVGGRRDELGHRVFPRAGRALENVVGTLLLGRRLADPDSQSREVVGAERLGDRTQSVVSREPTTELDLQSARFEVQFVVRDDESREVLE